MTSRRGCSRRDSTQACLRRGASCRRSRWCRSATRQNEPKENDMNRLFHKSACTCDCSGVATSLIPISLNWKGAIMSKLSVFVALSAAIAESTAGADDKLRATLKGFEEVPSVSTEATATFEAVISPNGDAIDYEITYSGLQAPKVSSRSEEHTSELQSHLN